MRQFLIYLLGGVAAEDYVAADERHADKIDQLRSDNEDYVRLLINDQDAAMRHASVQLQQLQEMLRQKELECEGIERGRVAMNKALNEVMGERDIARQQRDKKQDQMDRLRGELADLRDERDTLKAKLSRPKKPKPAKVEA